MVQFFADAGSLSSALETNGLLTLAYYVDEMVCLLQFFNADGPVKSDVRNALIVRFRSNMYGTLIFILLDHFGRIPSTATSVFETDVRNKIC